MALTVEWSVGGPPDVGSVGAVRRPGRDVPCRCVCWFPQRDDTGEIVAVEVMRGRHKEIDGGENKQGETPHQTVDCSAPTTASRLMAATSSKSTPSTWSRR